MGLSTLVPNGESGVDSYGALEGMRGSGKLTGTLFDTDGDGEPDGIDDHYTGTVTLTG